MSGEFRRGSVEVPALVQVADDRHANGALPFAGNRDPELFEEIVRQRPSRRQRPLQRRRFVAERQTAGVVVVLPVEVLLLDLAHGVGIALGADFLEFRFFLFFLRFRFQLGFLLLLFLALGHLLQRGVLEELLLDPETQLHDRQGQHLDGLAHLRGERQPLLLGRPDPDFRAESRAAAHCHSKSSPRYARRTVALRTSSPGVPSKRIRPSSMM